MTGPTGTSGPTGPGPTVLFSRGVESNSVGFASETTLQTFNMPANVMSGAGQTRVLRIKSGGRMDGAGIRNGRIRVYFGTTIVAEFTDVTTGGWGCEATVIRAADAAQRATSWIILSALNAGSLDIAGQDVVARVNPAEDSTAAILIRVTGENLTDASGGTVGSDFMTVELLA